MREPPHSLPEGIPPRQGAPHSLAQSTQGCTTAAATPGDQEAAAFTIKRLFSLAGAGERHVSPAWPVTKARLCQPKCPQTAPTRTRLLRQPWAAAAPGDCPRGRGGPCPPR